MNDFLLINESPEAAEAENVISLSLLPEKSSVVRKT